MASTHTVGTKVGMRVEGRNQESRISEANGLGKGGNCLSWQPSVVIVLLLWKVSCRMPAPRRSNEYNKIAVG